MGAGQVQNKEVREFLRASELPLGFIRDTSNADCNAFELLLIKAYAERLKSGALHIENIPSVQTSKKTVGDQRGACL
jgi:hypothetical protein